MELDRKKLIRRKLSSISKTMKQEGIDAWIVFTREGNPDPVAVDFGLGTCTWRSAGILTQDNEMHAIVGSFDSKAVSRSGLYDEVIGYGSEGPVEALQNLARKIGFTTVAVNESEDFGLADGLSSGMKSYLKKHLKHIGKFVSSEDLIIELRGRLLTEEIAKLSKAIRLTEEILDQTERNAIKAGVKDKQVFEYIQKLTREHGATFSWDAEMDPSICVGKIEPQHSPYDNVMLRKGKMLRIDFGIKLDGYCSDLQRVYFFGNPPSNFEEDFAFAREANDAAIRKLAPDARGLEVDHAGREVVLRNGFKNFMHGLGHALGTTAHEIGPILAPQWRNRYGRAMDKILGTNIVFTIEPTIYSKFGGINLEQDVLLDSEGFVKELSIPQKQVITL
ncbi:MAG: M24 family metallopeptidase [archaeon]|nr:M24 family metallopeptidase [archaeon]